MENEDNSKGKGDMLASKKDDENLPMATFYDENSRNENFIEIASVSVELLANVYGIDSGSIGLFRCDSDPIYADEHGKFKDLISNEPYFVLNRFYEKTVPVNGDMTVVKLPRFVDVTVRDLVDRSCGRRTDWQQLRVSKISDSGAVEAVSNESDLVIHQYEYQIEDLTKWPTVTVLVLGETGVGKSTWINGISNYVVHDNLEDAMNGEMLYVIPSQFSVTRKGETRKIQVGEEDQKREILAIGKSATQSPSVYTFYDDERRRILRLIDTPGIGDVEGQQKDDENFKKIVDCVAREKIINGICILLKPNNARLGVVFRYCINELLTHLSRSAAANIAFCFTNCRATFYEPGETWPILLDYVADLERNGTSIQLENYFCFDNEAFRFLACVKNGIDMTAIEKDLYADSWEKSVDTTVQLFNYFRSIKPHLTRETVSVNQARDHILTITRPLAEVCRQIQDNITAIADKDKEIASIKNKNADLKGRLTIPHISYECVPIDYPRTVCAGTGCTTSVAVEGTRLTQTHYTTICHSHCYLTNITPETFPEPGLQNCAAMISGGYDATCRICRCRWDVHIHIRYLQEKRLSMVDDENVLKDLNSNKKKKAAVKQFRIDLQNRVNQFKDEQKQINVICAKFGHFLKNSSILPYNDAVESYLKMLIKEERRKVCVNDEMVDCLEANLDAYKQQKTILESAMTSSGSAVTEITADDVMELKDRLTKLPLCGADLKKAFDMASASVDVQHSRSYVTVNKDTRGKGIAKKGWLQNARSTVSHYLPSFLKKKKK